MRSNNMNTKKLVDEVVVLAVEESPLVLDSLLRSLNQNLNLKLTKNGLWWHANVWLK